jgi:hypothetical protein
MNDDRSASSAPNRSAFAWLFWVGFVVVVVYPLSTGPVWWLCRACDLDSSYEIRLTVYAPLVALCSVYDPLNHFMNLYFGLWGNP